MTQVREVRLGGMRIGVVTTLVILLGATAVVYRCAEQQFVARNPDRINVRWTSDTPRSARLRVESSLGLRDRERRDRRTWSYVVSDHSPEGLRRIVEAPGVEDTHGIDRRAFTLTEPVIVPRGQLLMASLGRGILAAMFAALGLWLFSVRSTLLAAARQTLSRASFLASRFARAARERFSAWMSLAGAFLGLGVALAVVWVTARWRLDKLPGELVTPTADAAVIVIVAIVCALALGPHPRQAGGHRLATVGWFLVAFLPAVATLGAAGVGVYMWVGDGFATTNPSDATYFSDVAAVTELVVSRGNDVNAAYDVAPGVVFQESASLLPLEAALLSGDDRMVELILRLGATLDRVDVPRIRCAIEIHGQRRPQMLARTLALWPDAGPLADDCVPGEFQW